MVLQRARPATLEGVAFHGKGTLMRAQRAAAAIKVGSPFPDRTGFVYQLAAGSFVQMNVGLHVCRTFPSQCNGGSSRLQFGCTSETTSPALLRLPCSLSHIGYLLPVDGRRHTAARRRKF